MRESTKNKQYNAKDSGFSTKRNSSMPENGGNNQWGKNTHELLQANHRLASANARSADIMAELEIKNDKLTALNSQLANANAMSAELMAELEEKNEELKKVNQSLAKANIHSAELMAVVELKDEKIQKLNKALAEVNARSANLVAKREFQVVKIRELNRELQYEIDIREKVEQSLKKSNETKDRFFSIIAHDLRNPFISIVSLVTALNENADSFSKEEIIDLIGDLHSDALNTQNLLENLLQWSKTQTGHLKVDPGLYRLRSIIEESFSVCAQHAGSKNISIESEVDEETTVWADKNMINTVIRNLVSNSIKFSEPGGKICLTSKQKDGKVYVRIQDFGTGISPQNMEKLFRIDAKITSKGTANEKGSGLGLILCKEFVELNGGKISVESKPGQGSTFTFSIPSTGKIN